MLCCFNNRKDEEIMTETQLTLKPNPNKSKLQTIPEDEILKVEEIQMPQIPQIQEIPDYLTKIINWNQTTNFIPPIEIGQVIKVYDGDTITIANKLPYHNSPLYRFQIRLAGIDSPEIKGKTEEEKNAAKKSQKALEELILYKIVYLENKKIEKYGRILADVYVDITTNSEEDSEPQKLNINQWMLDNKYAIKYNGKTKEEFDITNFTK